MHIYRDQYFRLHKKQLLPEHLLLGLMTQLIPPQSRCSLLVTVQASECELEGAIWESVNNLLHIQNDVAIPTEITRSTQNLVVNTL